MEAEDGGQGNSSDTSSNSSTTRANVSRRVEKVATDGVDGPRGESSPASRPHDAAVLDEGIQQEVAQESRSRSTDVRGSSLEIASVDRKLGPDGVLIDVSSKNKLNSVVSEGVSGDDLIESVPTSTYAGGKGAEATSSTTLLHPGCARFEPEQICSRVEGIVSSWEGVAPMQPDVFLYKLLSSRGYDSSVIPAREYRVPPTEKQMKEYDVILVDAVRRSDLTLLMKLRDEGRCMNACNKHSESILHMAARRSNYETVKFILENGGDLNIVDDYGRTPLHDACWRNGVSFDVITLLLNRDLDLLRTADVRGACPLSYVREEFWMHWCAYFYNQKEKYWNYTVEDGVNTPAAFDPSAFCLEPLIAGITDDIISKSTAPPIAVVPEDGAEEESSGTRSRRRKAAVMVN